MTAPELVHTIEVAGGVLRLNGERIRCSLPVDAAPLVDQLRAHRSEVFGLLKQRFADSTCRWLRSYCVASSACVAEAKILYREYCGWDEADSTGSYDAFMELLANAGFHSNERGMVMGLCLVQDFLAAWRIEQGRRPQ